MDGGRSWTYRKILDECITTPEEFNKSKKSLSEQAKSGYYESQKRIINKNRIGMTLNTPRLLCLSDGQLILIVDYYDKKDRKGWINIIYRSFDSGETWSEPEDLKIPQGLVPSLNELRDGRIMLGLTKHKYIKNNKKFDLISDANLVETQLVYFSDDKGNSWSEPVTIPSFPGQNFSEGSFVELDDTTIFGILRDDNKLRGYKVLSHDGGITWTDPLPTLLIGLAGRPKAGLLKTGEVCITYRLRLPNKMLGLHLMTQDSARSEESVDDCEIPWYLRYKHFGRTAVLDMDRSVYYDGGYSGWAQLDSGEIYVVDYIIDDAPLAHIRGYLVNRSDIILFPEGDVPTIAPVNLPTPFVETAFDLAEKQYKKNFNKECK